MKHRCHSVYHSLITLLLDNWHLKCTRAILLPIQSYYIANIVQQSAVILSCNHSLPEANSKPSESLISRSNHDASPSKHCFAKPSELKHSFSLIHIHFHRTRNIAIQVTFTTRNKTDFSIPLLLLDVTQITYQMRSTITCSPIAFITRSPPSWCSKS